MNFFGRAIVTIVIVLTTAPVPCAQSGRQGNKAPPSAYDKAFALLQQGESVEALAEIDTALSASPGRRVFSPRSIESRTTTPIEAQDSADRDTRHG